MNPAIDDQVRLGALTRGFLGILPDIVSVNRGLFYLSTLRPGRRLSIGALLEHQARRYPRRPALRFEDRGWTYRAFNRWANRCADACARAGVVHGDVVAVLMQNRPEALACVAGTVKLGGIAGMLNHQQRGDALLHSLDLIHPKLLVVGEECAQAWDSVKDRVDTRAMTLYWDGNGPAPRGFTNTHDVLVDANPVNPSSTREVFGRQACFYIFTSGTTGLPKASIMTHHRWLSGMAGFGRLGVRLHSTDILYCPLPLFHNDALTVSWGATLGTGACLALDRKFSASRFWDEIRHHDATAFCYIGELCRYLLNQPPTPRDRAHRVRVVVGNGLRPDLWDAFQDRFGIDRICEFYGASECNLAFLNVFGLRRTTGFTPMKYTVVEWNVATGAPLRDADGWLRKMPKGEPGLLLTQVTDRAPFDGYTDDDAGQAKLVRDAFKLGDSWFNTGDLVREQGFRHIQFVDRLGDTFRWKGENVATTEVEAALRHCVGVEQAVVYGVKVPGADGRAGMAALSMSAGNTCLDGAVIAQELQRRLPAYAVPLFVRVEPELRTTSTFKYLKSDLQYQGFDRAAGSSPLYVLLDRERGYEPLTAEHCATIEAGKLRL